MKSNQRPQVKSVQKWDIRVYAILSNAVKVSDCVFRFEQKAWIYIYIFNKQF